MPCFLNSNWIITFYLWHCKNWDIIIKFGMFIENGLSHVFTIYLFLFYFNNSIEQPWYSTHLSHQNHIYAAFHPSLGCDAQFPANCCRLVKQILNYWLTSPQPLPFSIIFPLLHRHQRQTEKVKVKTAVSIVVTLFLFVQNNLTIYV